MQSYSMPTSVDVKRAVAHICSPHHARYFFERLNNPNWIMPLYKEKVFDRPPSAVRLEGGVQARNWPQSRYLARMADKAPAEVSAILAMINTDNWTVAADIIRAAKSMPAEHSAKLVPQIARLVNSLRMEYESIHIAECIAGLVRGGKTNAAFELACATFDAGKYDEKQGSNNRDDFLFVEGMRKWVVPAFLEVEPLRILEFLLNGLAQIVKPEKSVFGEDDDRSHWWLQAIEDDGHSHYEFRQRYAALLRDAFTLGVKGKHITLEAALELLASRKLLLLRRLRIHLINEFADEHADLARVTMLMKEHIGDELLKHEYARLLKKRFPMLCPEDQQKWLDWAKEGPEAFDPEYFDQAADDAKKALQRDYWQYKKLSWIHEHLTGTNREFYNRMLGEHGPALFTDRTFEVSWSGREQSPYSVEDLGKMEFAGVLDVVQDAIRVPEAPSQRFDHAEAIVDTFRGLIASDPTEYSARAKELTDKYPPVIQRFLGAIIDGVKKHSSIDLGCVLELGEWVVSRPPNETFKLAGRDPFIRGDWIYCRDALAELIEEVCKSKREDKSLAYGFEHRKRIWNVLSKLVNQTADGDRIVPSAKDDPRLKDWLTSALNSSRGIAISAVLAYAEWVANHEQPEWSIKPPFAKGFSAIPEVRETLDACIRGALDSFIARAAIGKRLNLILLLDETWLKQVSADLFNLSKVGDDFSTAHGWAAWNTFLYCSEPHVRFYKILREQFDLAVSHAAIISPTSESHEAPFHRLAEHALILFARGDLGKNPVEAFEANNELVKRLVTASIEPIRSHAMRFLGKCIDNQNEPIPPETVGRLTYLWEQYWEAVGEQDAKNDPASYVFGNWFGCKAFDTTWALDQLEKFVRAAPMANPDHIIMERLAEVCQIDPLKCAHIVGLLVEGDVENWRISSWEDEARKVLECALKAGDEANHCAYSVVNRLGRKGFTEFGTLLK